MKNGFQPANPMNVAGLSQACPGPQRTLQGKNCDMALRRCTKVSEGCEPLRKRWCRVIDDKLSNYLKESHPAVDGMVARRRDREVIQIITGTGRGRGPIQTRFFVEFGTTVGVSP